MAIKFIDGLSVVGLSTFASITVSGGSITLSGTGRIQGVDTVSASTDAANKAYVDAAVAGVPVGDITAVVAGTGISGGGTSGSVTITNSAPNIVQTTITGNAGTVTNGVYTVGTQTIGGVKTFSSQPKAPTPATSNNSTSVATTAYVKNQGYTTNTGTTTASNTQTFTNKSGNISQWTNDSGYTTSVGDITGITPGTGISGGGTSGTVTVTNSDRGSSQNIYKNIAVSGQSTVVADSNNDTLTFAAAGGMTITTDAATDTITFNPNDDNSNYYVSAASYSGGILTLTRNGLSALEATGFPTNNNQLTNGSGYTTNTGTTTASNVQTFTNKSGSNNQWTNDAGYITSASLPTVSNATVTVSTGGGLDGGTTFTLNQSAAKTISLSLDLNELGAGGTLVATDSLVAVNGTASNKQLISSIPLSIFNNNSGWTSNTGTTTASNTQTFTNKSGNISQWTNDAGYTTSVGDITGVTAGSGLTGGGTSGTVTVNVDYAGSGNLVDAATAGSTITTLDKILYEDNTDTTVKEIAISSLVALAPQGDITGITAGTGISGGGTSGNVTITNSAPNIVQTTVTGNAGTATKLQTARTIAGVSFDGSANISLNNNAITNGAGYITSYVNTTYTAGTGLLLTGTVFSNTITNNNQLDNGRGFTTNTGTTTASNTQTFTNKSGNISQWTNNSGYTTNVGDITGVTAGTNLTGGGTSGSVTLNMATGGAGAASYGSTSNSTKIDTITLDAYGRVTAVTTGGTGQVNTVATGNSSTLTSSGSTAKTLTPVTAAVSSGSAALATGAQIQTAINSATTGVLTYQGTWNASTNSPTLASATGTPGYYYIVSVAGSTNLDGITDWAVGDWAVFSDLATDAWQKIDNTQVGSVTGSGSSGRVAYWNSSSGITSDSGLTFNGGTNALTVGGAVTWSGGGSTESNSAYDNMVTGFSDSGTSTKTLTLTQQDGGTLTTSFSIPQGDITGITAGTGITGGGTSGTVTITNSAPNIVQTTITGNAGSATVLQTARTIAGVSFNGSANISLNNNAITNGAGYTTNVGDITGVTAGTGLSGGGTSGTVSLALDLGELAVGGTLVATDYLIAENGGVDNRQLISSIPLSIFSNNSGWTSNTGTTTASNTQTFTNKSGNISQWSNNSGYTTNTGTTTASNSQTFTNKGGNISQWTNDSGYVTSSGGSMSSWILKEGNGTESTSVTNGETVTFAQGNGITSEMTSTSSGGTLTITNTKPNIVQTTVSGNAGTATTLQTARTIAGVSFNGSANISLNNNAITNGAGYITSYVNTTYTAGTGLLLTGTVFSNTITNNNQLDNGRGFTTNTGTTTASNTQTFTNKSGNISQWTNDSGYTTNTGDITGVTAGSGISGGGTSGTVTVTNSDKGSSQSIFKNIAVSGQSTVVADSNNDTLTLVAAGGMTITTNASTDTITFNPNDDNSNYYVSGASYASGTLTLTRNGLSTLTATGFPTNNNQLSNGSGYTTNTGTTTASNTQTFTNKSGNISQWTNNSGYTTNVGDITGVTAGTGLSGGGTSGSVTLTLDLGELGVGNTLVGTDYLIAENGGADKRQLVSSIPLSIFSNNAGWTTNTGTTTASNSQTFTNKGGNISQWTNNSGYTTNTGDITAVNVGTGLSGGGTSGSVTITNTAPNIVQTTVTGNAGTVTNGAYVNVSNNFTQIQKTTLSEPKLQLISNSSPSLTAGLGTQVGGQLLSFGTNYSQGGNRNNSYVGGYFRIDTRTGAESEFFNIQRIPASGSETIIFKVSSTGSVVASGNVTAYSDERLKSNIETIDNALDKVNALRGVTFTKDGERGLGVIAQEVEKVLPEVVLDGEYKSVAYGNIVGVLIEAVKEQNAKIERLEGLIELMLKDK